MVSGPLFKLGQVVATQGALREAGNDLIIACIRRHVLGDWGAVGTEDQATNDEAVSCGLRILSGPAPAMAPTRCGSSPNTTAA